MNISFDIYRPGSSPSHVSFHLCRTADLSKSLSQLIVSIFILSQHFFLINFARWKSVGLPQYCLYRNSLTLTKLIYMTFKVYDHDKVLFLNFYDPNLHYLA